MVDLAGAPRTQEAVFAGAEHAELPLGSVRRLGRLRLPVTLTTQPWATLYQYPDGRRIWTVRLWWLDRPVSRLVPTDRLRRYARASGLHAVLAEIDDLLARCDRPGSADGP
ncbi:MAG TPA: hypothetical protein VGV89_09665 [Thermoplasmata archaeon]|nr:hypothetical protein [Thermoplasmata archaeon]